MTTFIYTLLKGGPAFTVEAVESGFLIHRVEGHDSGFNDIARAVMNNSGSEYSAFPRSDGCGGYDCVHVILHER
ncbi:hypothetical protein RM53_16620 [Brevundimonas nasdae]|uniref:Uncharacterized protein n=1 Tax=Brevundimonas nasdae TaxID=172043 RepID=A0A0B4CMJ9_9CAUL|nr:hypothetical protein [Brevundimonas nasdae]KIC53160.1 hypothetical protein RM53_16620 [Brevundimonas nasdae]